MSVETEETRLLCVNVCRLDQVFNFSAKGKHTIKLINCSSPETQYLEDRIFGWFWFWNSWKLPMQFHRSIIFLKLSNQSFNFATSQPRLKAMQYIGTKSRFLRRFRSDLTRSLLKERLRCDLKRLKNRLHMPLAYRQCQIWTVNFNGFSMCSYTRELDWGLQLTWRLRLTPNAHQTEGRGSQRQQPKILLGRSVRQSRFVT